MKSFKFTIQGNKYDVNILNIEDNTAEIEVNGTVYKVELEKKMSAPKTPKLVRSFAVPSTESTPSQLKTSSPTAPKGTGFIKSPLPGVILEIHVKEGDKVSIGQKLITLEAMKMENNINADKEGIVKSIKVQKGDNVLEGDTLIEIG
ncbi:MAG: biotin/lipoyl-binding protein [Ignavibacterium sp.]|nr:biotin/lipoyl-binding protein [Ignavibacterium sp.]MCX7610583.1 biotin/lipoyl-binding protein [Ignavibacterium sp.]MDW8374169.1 biotin/lipoyl-containing protein [Ignavibacteriales bacterium]